MKKALSILLTVTLLLSMVTCAFTASAASSVLTAADLPLDFEDFAVGTNLKGTFFEHTADWNTFAVAEDEAGNHVAKANCRYSTFYVSIDPSVFEDGAYYTISFDMKADAAYDATNGNFLEVVYVLLKENADDTTANAMSYSSNNANTRATGEWQTVTVSFPAIDFSDYSAVVLKLKYNSNTDAANGGYLMMDNFQVQKNAVEIDKTALSLTESADTDDTLKVLAIGNSFSSDAVHFLKSMLKANDKDLRVGNCWVSGATLQLHLNSLYDGSKKHTFGYYTKDQSAQSFSGVGLWQVLHSTDWDVISLQQASVNSGQANTYEPYLKNLITAIQSVLPDAEIILHQTWAYDTESTRKLSEGGYKNQADMYQKLTAAYTNAAKTYGTRVIPVGAALQAARAAIPGDDFSRDLHHGNTKACLLFSYVWYETLTGISPDNNNYVYDGSLVTGGTIEETVPSDAVIATLKEVAHDTVVTQKYTDPYVLEASLNPTNYAPATWQPSLHWSAFSNTPTIGTVTESHLGGSTFTNSSGAANYQSIVTSNVELLANTEYRLSLSVKGMTADTVKLLEYFYIYKAGVCETVTDDQFPASGSAERIGFAKPTVDADHSNDSWLRVYFDFTTSDLTSYDLRLKWGDVSSFTISDVALYARTSVTATAVGNGSATVSDTAGYVGQRVTLTATPDSGETLHGWYNGETLLSTASVYNHTLAAGANAVTASFTKNILKWQGKNWARPELTTAEYAYQNGPVWYLAGGIAWQRIHLEVDLKANTKYNLTTYLNIADANVTLQHVAVYLTSGVTWSSDKGASPTISSTNVASSSSFTAVDDNWKKLSAVFTTGDTDANYTIIVKFQNDAASQSTNYGYVSDTTLREYVTASAEALGGGTAIVSATTGLVDDIVTYTATADSGEEFLGWYSGNTLVTTEPIYQTTLVSGNNKLTARFTTNDLTNPAAWKACVRDPDASIALTDEVLTVSNIQWDYFYLPITLETSTNYYFNFDVRSHIQMEWLMIVPQSLGLGYKDNGNAADGNGNYFSNAPANGSNKTGKYKTQFTTANTWYENNSYAFQTNATDRYYYVIIKTADILTDGTKGGSMELKNISITKPVSTAVVLEDKATGRKGNAAIRAAGDAEGGVVKNGVRTYNELNKQFIADKNIVEYGSIVVRQDYMEKLEANKASLEGNYPGISDVDFTTPNLDMLGIPGVGHGLSYRSQETVIGSALQSALLWKDNGTGHVFTSYITGIDEKYYGDEYLIRSYAIDSAGTVYYGDISSVSVFKIVNAMDHTETLAGVSAVAKAAYDAFVTADESTKAAYVTWCEQNGTTVGNLFES